ncbi:hypothetical protein [Kitasatospora sp. NPDC059673]|uniref:hypothetical protein n=1 Tax=Kitasatospora sp. NPDC059673 TaxID=3346901 RepID=UPI0036CCE798
MRGIPDLRWDDVQEFFDPDLMGALPEVSVPGTSAEDWQALFDLVAGTAGWTWEYAVGGVAVQLASSVANVP